MSTITTLSGELLDELPDTDDNPDAALYRAIELAAAQGPVLLSDDEGCHRVHGCGWVETALEGPQRPSKGAI